MDHAQPHSETNTHICISLLQGVQTLVQQETTLSAVQERHLQLEGSVTQRLKWAAGANPTLSQVLQQFEEALAAKNRFLQVMIYALAA